MGPPHELMLSRYHAASPEFRDSSTDLGARVVFATRTAQVRVLTAEDWATVQHDPDRLPPTQRADLASIELLVPEGEDELSTVLTRTRQAISAGDILRVVIHPTAQCPLACDYCGQAHSAKWLSHEHQTALLAQVRLRLLRGGYKQLAVAWFGAEPLSGMRVIRALTALLRDLAADLNVGYSASMTSNGLAMTPEIAAELVHDLGLREVTVSLDGPREAHDARRMRKNGKPTFDTIFQNLIQVAALPDLPLEITVRTNVDRRNADAVIPLVRQLAAAGLQDRIGYYVAPIHSWGNDADRLGLSATQFAALELGWMEEMLTLGFTPGLLPSPVDTTCIAVERDSLVVDANGELFNCTEASYVPIYGAPNRFATGHLSTGEEPQRRNLLANFNNRVGDGQLPCSSCRMLPVCGGACPKAWLDGHEPCPSAKRNIEGRLLIWNTEQWRRARNPE